MFIARFLAQIMFMREDVTESQHNYRKGFKDLDARV